MYLVYQYGDENYIAFCLTKTSADDIVKFVGEDAWVEKIKPVDLDQFVKSREE